MCMAKQPCLEVNPSDTMTVGWLCWILHRGWDHEDYPDVSLPTHHVMHNTDTHKHTYTIQPLIPSEAIGMSSIHHSHSLIFLRAYKFLFKLLLELAAWCFPPIGTPLVWRCVLVSSTEIGMQSSVHGVPIAHMLKLFTRFHRALCTVYTTVFKVSCS